MSTLTLRKSPMSEAVAGLEMKTSEAMRVGVPSPSPSDDAPLLEARNDPPDDDPYEGDGEIRLPSGWSKGALLNVRNRGDHYCITLYPEEFDPRYPERALMFPNTWTCQDFVSKWYNRESPDPRAR